MNTQKLLQMALGKIGKANPSANDYQQALDSFNMILDSFAYWNPDDQPIYEITDINATVNLPPYYIEVLILMVAVAEAPAYGISNNDIGYLEAKITKLTNKLIYRRQSGDIPFMVPTTMVV